ncbi:hypothetical protein [Propionicicella superfundia]|uniref:hypothetical protein n=1 Tax=Propionicicella superfundia TaxID=348582 RepID=UPI0004061ED9|nr:hypothetical protein [Propionicicella superfundia]
MAGRAVLLALHVALLSVLVGVSAAMVTQSVADIRAASRLVDLRAVYFVAAATDQPPRAASETLRRHLVDVLTSGRAYALRSPADAGPQPENTLVGYGSLARVFQLAQVDALPPYALAGTASGHRPGQSVLVDGVDVPIVAAIEDAGYLDLWMGFQPLSGTVVVVGDIERDLARASDAEIHDIAARLVITDATGADIAAHLTATAGTTTLFPRWAGDKISLDYEPELRGRTAFLGVFLAGALTTVVGAFGGLQALVRSRRRDLVVHIALGAGTPHLYVRLLTFVVFAWALPAVVFGWAGAAVVDGGHQAATVAGRIALVVACVAVAIPLLAARSVARTDHYSALRESTW